MSTTPSDEDVIDSEDLARQLGISQSMVVAEFGFDEDADENVPVAIEAFLGANLVGEDTDEVFDVALVWFRDGDGDLVDVLVDVITGLGEDGTVWLLTPKRGRTGYVQPSDIAEAAPIAGLSQTSLATVSANWTGTRLVPRRSGGSKTTASGRPGPAGRPRDNPRNDSLRNDLLRNDKR